MQQIIDTMPSGMMVLDDEGGVALANPRARKYLALLAGAEVGNRLSHLGRQALSGLLVPMQPGGTRQELRTEDGSRTFTMASHPLLAYSGRTDWVVILDDVSEEHRVRDIVQQQERLATVGQMAAGIAHDFNNTLASVVLYAQMLQGYAHLNERERHGVQVINEQAQHASRIIRQILDFSRRSVMERAKMDIVPFVNELAKLLVHTLPANIEIAFSCEEKGYWVEVDPTRVCNRR